MQRFFMQQNDPTSVLIVELNSMAKTTFKSTSMQRELYQLHYRRIYNTCLRIIGNRMDAEEAMHDVFLKLFNHLEHLKDEKAIYAWSRTVAIRTSIDRVRKKKRWVFEQVERLHQSITDDEPDEEEVEEPLELSVEAIKSQLNHLPDGYRVVVSMRLFEESSFEEIAKMLHIRESTARSQYVRGREKLSNLLKSKMNQP